MRFLAATAVFALSALATGCTVSSSPPAVYDMTLDIRSATGSPVCDASISFGTLGSGDSFSSREIDAPVRTSRGCRYTFRIERFGAGGSRWATWDNVDVFISAPLHRSISTNLDVNSDRSMAYDVTMPIF